MKLTRNLAALALAALIAVGATACQPQPGTVVRPPANATHAHGIKDASLYMNWTFDATYCVYTLTVTDPTNHVVWTASGGPAVGSTFVVPQVTGRFAAWITSSGPKGKPCGSKVTMVDSI